MLPPSEVDLILSAVPYEINEVISGACGVKKRYANNPARGGDGLGERWANRNGIPVTRFYAEDYGLWPGAGPRRNRAMAEYALALIAFPGGSGTRNMIHEARKRGLHVIEVDYTNRRLRRIQLPSP